MCAKARIIPLRMSGEKSIFRFSVALLDGPLTKTYVRRHPEPPSRVIEIRGKQSLDDLHEAIFKAFDRYDPHMYEFQVGGKRPMDRKSARYGISEYQDDPGVGDAEITSIAMLGLKEGQKFFYWFDFGDDWWHEIKLLSTADAATGKGRFPRIVERKGESPPQYPDWDEDGNGDEEAEEGETYELTDAERELLATILIPIREFCLSRLTESYVTVCGDLLATCLMAGLPLHRGKPQSWAAGIVHAVGMVNFLQDPASTPHLKLRDIAKAMGSSLATMENKSREIRDALGIIPLDPRFCLPEKLANNPLVWLKEINGFIVDLRSQPREVQEAALKAGMIPFLPEAPSERSDQEKGGKKIKKPELAAQAVKKAEEEEDKEAENPIKPDQHSLFD